MLCAAKQRWGQGDNVPLQVKGSALIGFGAKPQKTSLSLISQVFVNEENFGRLSAGRKLERRDDVTHGAHALRRIAGAVFGTGRF